MGTLATIVATAVLFYVIYVTYNCFCRKSSLQTKTDQRTSLSIVPDAYKMTAIDKDIFLYHRLQNPSTLEAQVINDARTRLLELLDYVISKAHNSPQPHSNVLSIKEYCPGALNTYLSTMSMSTTSAWCAYLARRKAGGRRELFSARKYAEYWLERAAPVKFVDGAWLSRLHHPRTPSGLRHITRILWQIISEELGDGDLEKNHVHVYACLLWSFGSKLPAGDSREFIDPNINPNDDASVWAAAIVQLTLGLFPEEFLPEALGFNLAYECVALDTMVAACELKELDLDPAYFNLHITIDNADSGHTAMALDAVIKFMRIGDAKIRQQRWRRIQAGYLLATEISPNPKVPGPTELAALEIFSHKVNSSYAAHQLCRGLMGGRLGMSLQAWMDPSEWGKRKFRFAAALANSRWVTRGEPSKSRFLKELEWKGRMFGAFTTKERVAIKQWIQSLEPLVEQTKGKGRYHDFTGSIPKAIERLQPLNLSAFLKTTSLKLVEFNTVVLIKPISQQRIATLLLYSLVPLQSTLASPAKVATYEGMIALRIIRVLNGFSAKVDVVDGMDEVCCPSHRSIWDLAALVSSVQLPGMMLPLPLQKEATWQWLERVALDPENNFWFLIGVQYGFMINLATNRSFLRASGIKEDVITALESIGTVVLGELDCLCIEKRWESQLGLSVASSFLVPNESLPPSEWTSV